MTHFPCLLRIKVSNCKLLHANLFSDFLTMLQSDHKAQSVSFTLSQRHLDRYKYDRHRIFLGCYSKKNNESDNLRSDLDSLHFWRLNIVSFLQWMKSLLMISRGGSRISRWQKRKNWIRLGGGAGNFCRSM